MPGGIATDIFGHLARGVVEFSTRRYLRREDSTRSEDSWRSRRRSSRRSSHGTTALLGQVAAGVAALLARRYISNRKQKREAERHGLSRRESTGLRRTRSFGVAGWEPERGGGGGGGGRPGLRRYQSMGERRREGEGHRDRDRYADREPNRRLPRPRAPSPPPRRSRSYGPTYGRHRRR